jgi:glycosyltransferase involved in cell wall biosynthesis
MKLIALTSRATACDYHRVTLPLMYLPIDKEKDSVKFCFKGEHDLKVGHFQDVDWLYFNRLPNKDLSYLNMVRKGVIDSRTGKMVKGFKMVMDLDDYWELYSRHILKDQWDKDKIPLKTTDMIKSSDMIFTTNERLAAEITPINRNVHILPNAFPFGEQQFTINQRVKRGKIRFVYVGGRTHYYDLNTISSVFSNIGSDKELRDKLEFVLAGYTDKELYWETAFNLINNSKVCVKKPYEILNRYMNLYNGEDVVIAPLENNRFNTFKSNLKVIEAGCKKMPIIASNIWPYLEDEEMDGKGLILCKNNSDWMDAIKFFVDNPDKIDEFGQNLYDYVSRKYNLREINEKRYNLLKS